MPGSRPGIESNAARVVYSRHYNIGFWGLERLHAFDSRKYARAWRLLRQRFGRQLKTSHLRPRRPTSRDQLLLVHTEDYLARLKDSRCVAGVIEMPPLRRLPAWAIDRHVLRPMRWAVQGTICAAEAALDNGLAINLGGGFHHAKPDRGEGFSAYADVGIAIQSLRGTNQIQQDSRIVYVDTDAHQGNGVCHTFMNDNKVFIFDIFNARIYPMFDVEARKRIDCEVPLLPSTSDTNYMQSLRESLPGFLDSVCRSDVGIAFYNAGTDVYEFDQLGGLCVTANSILQRDLFVVGELRKRGIPTVMVLSGGYSKESYRLVARSVIALLEYHGQLPS